MDGALVFSEIAVWLLLSLEAPLFLVNTRNCDLSAGLIFVVVVVVLSDGVNGRDLIVEADLRLKYFITEFGLQIICKLIHLSLCIMFLL